MMAEQKDAHLAFLTVEQMVELTAGQMVGRKVAWTAGSMAFLSAD
jgi:hypothetical protein